MKNLTDESPMPWGKHKGEAMINVPASYLLWCYENEKCSDDVKEYIIDNMAALKEELKLKRK